MNGDPLCGVCRKPGYPDDDYTNVLVTHKNINDRDQQEDYFLHQQCARHIFDGWGEP